jgi:D-alanine--D-alanine ligase
MRTPTEIATAFASRDQLSEMSRFFLVGIGGAGMSALARLLRDRGLEVLGSDSTVSPEVERLRAEGFEVRVGHSPLEHAHAGETALILSDAIPLDVSPEVASARQLGIPIFRRSQLLGWLLQGRRVIAVTGTHGKTTTTGMMGAALEAAGLDPLVIVGASIPDWGGPVRYGKGEWAVVEACEAYDSFHDLDPEVVVLTNLELDHVDFHGNWENLRGSVLRFVSKLGSVPTGTLLYCADDPGACELAAMANGIAAVAYRGSDLQSELAVPGKHNRTNAAGAMAAANQAGADPTLALHGVAAFRGAGRRLQLLYEGRVTVYDDYAHHPTEIAASLSALREKSPGRRLVVAFQPHLYSRTAPLIQEFADALSLADLVVLTDIYPAREAPMPGISSALIAEKIGKTVRYVPSRHLLPLKVARWLRPGDVIVGMGAGNIADFAPALIDELAREERSGLRVAVLYGGDSAEREVSLHSGLAVHAALTRLGHQSALVDMTDLLLSKGNLAAFLGFGRPDLAFLAVHGTHAEDGAIQGLLEMLHIPYTGSGIQASAIAMDKAMTKRILQANGIRVPRGVYLAELELPLDLHPPLVVKPNAQGSTVGLSFVDIAEDLCPALATAFAYDDAVLVEEWVRGMEISVPILDEEALPPVEIVPVSGFYDFASKYQPGATEEVVPARLPEPTQREAQRIALAAHRILGCAGATRTDMIVRNPDSVDAGAGGVEIFVLEVNTLPGMTATSLLPNSARAAGISFDQLCQRLVEDALRRYEAKA